jgi:hypothetical protein
MFGSSHSMPPEMKTCIEDCHHCHLTCLEMSMTHCLERGGRHAEPAHMRLMADCAEVCETAMNFMARHSAHHEALCRTCAAICRACAASCEQLGDMQECVDACLRCAQSCECMAPATT